MERTVKRIAVVPGDGIGPEVIREAVGVLERLRETHGVRFELTHFDWGAEKFLNEGVTLPQGALEMLSREFDAVLAGAFGDPRVPSNKHAEDILLGMRRGLDLYINLRPVRLLHTRLTPLRDRKPEEYREALSEILEEAERTSKLVDSLMMLSRADSGKEDLERV